MRDYTEILSDANYKAKQNDTKGKGLKILTLIKASKIAYSSCTSESG